MNFQSLYEEDKMTQEQKRNIDKAKFIILRKFVGKESLEKKIRHLILRDEQ